MRMARMRIGALLLLALACGRTDPEDADGYLPYGARSGAAAGASAPMAGSGDVPGVGGSGIAGGRFGAGGGLGIGGLVLARGGLPGAGGFRMGGGPGMGGSAGIGGLVLPRGGLPGTGGRGLTVGGNGASRGMGTGATGCAVDQDCADLDRCTSDRCELGACTHGLRDDDRDGHVALSCGGDDCNDANPSAYSGRPEDCVDGADNDCNGAADCRDSACAGASVCGCTPDPSGETCNNGRDDDCDGRVDCLDPDCLGNPACGCTTQEQGYCENGLDDDCDGLRDCDDPECSLVPSCTCRDRLEQCTNGTDDDCDLLIDCADPDCAQRTPCVCQPPGSPESCNDGLDNDCNGLVDCADTSCLASVSCQRCTQEVCNDGVDNDCDGYLDCADQGCLFSPSCPLAPELCNNGLDDDADGQTDCGDPDCAGNPYCSSRQENCLTARLIPGAGSYFGDTTGNPSYTSGTCGGAAGEAVFRLVLDRPSSVKLDSIGSGFDSVLYVRAGSCGYGQEIGCDDDSAGNRAAALDFALLDPGIYYIFLDGFTVDARLGPNQGPFQLNLQVLEDPTEICADGLDNDGDHSVDCADSDCAAATHCVGCAGGVAPSAEFGPTACVDGRDDDCDGLTDCADPDCHASEYYAKECCNGTDDNGNGIIDDFACGCVTSADCSTNQLCYTHSIWACGLPCTRFVGDLCPFLAPGSLCSRATGQCEFATN
jgi:hypothetical protein